MKCTCLKKLENQLRPEIQRHYGSEKHPVRSFNMRKTASGRAIVNIFVDIVGKTKPKETFIVADYCPWCGQKYED